MCWWELNAVAVLFLDLIHLFLPVLSEQSESAEAPLTLPASQILKLNNQQTISSNATMTHSKNQLGMHKELLEQY